MPPEPAPKPTRWPSLDDVLPRLKNVRRNRRGWSARCPAHQDHSNSLSIDLGAEGRVLLHCFASCSFAEILAALGLERPAAPPRSPARPLSPIAEARANILRVARRQPWAQALDAYREADLIRVAGRLAARAHAATTAAGASEDGWTLAELATDLERALHLYEAVA